MDGVIVLHPAHGGFEVPMHNGAPPPGGAGGDGGARFPEPACMHVQRSQASHEQRGSAAISVVTIRARASRGTVPGAAYTG